MTVKFNQRTVQIKELLGRQTNSVESKFCPEVLYCAGPMDLPLLSPLASVIGSRNATESGLKETRRIAKFLAKNNVTVVSGLARGIDTMAHTTAMECKGRTIAVLGTPINRVHPKENSEIQNTIIKDHLAISQYPTGHVTKPRDFVLRNKTMALTSNCTIVVEAGDASGSLHQCRETLRLGRPLFICKGIMENDSLKWPKKMRDDGAMILDRLEDIMENIPPRMTAPPLFQ